MKKRNASRMQKAMTCAIALLAFSFNDLCAAPAFPGAEGYGAVSVGGRGGRIIEVTNLNGSGTGSLRAACDATGARIVVFRVAGTIDLGTSPLMIGNPYILIAGQTAPGGGIQIKAAGVNQKAVRIQTHDVVMQYLRVRHGYTTTDPGSGTQCIFIMEGSSNIILDHLSCGWASDENITIYSSSGTIKNITVQWCISAEGLKPANIAHNTHGAGLICGSNSNPQGLENVSVHHCFFIHNQIRNPYLKNRNAEAINNISYNWEGFALELDGGTKIDVINSIFKEGPSTTQPYWPQPVAWNSFSQPSKDGGPSGSPSIYIAGNTGRQVSNPDNDNWPLVGDVYSKKSPPASYRRSTPMADAQYAVTVHPAARLEDALFSHIGASRRIDENGQWVFNRDTVDKRYLNDYKRGTGRLPSNENEVGGFPVLAAGTAYSDTDHDGMADTWERPMFGNTARDGKSDYDNDGFSDVEEFLNGSDPKGNGSTPVLRNQPSNKIVPFSGKAMVYSIDGRKITTIEQASLESLSGRRSAQIGKGLVIISIADRGRRTQFVHVIMR